MFFIKQMNNDLAVIENSSYTNAQDHVLYASYPFLNFLNYGSDPGAMKHTWQQIKV